MTPKIFWLRVIHGAFAAYFILCLAYMYYAAFTGLLNWVLLVAVISLALEGIAVFILNHGDCPLIHIQRKIGDDTPFFEIFLSKPAAKRAIPIFAVITWVGLALLIVRIGYAWLFL